MGDAQRLIRWEKWIDPIAPHINRRYEDENGNLMVFKEDDAQGFDLDNPCVLTRIGMVPYHESNTPGKLFKFWVGHTNFDLDIRTAQKIQQEPGVESLDIYTRYRFRLGVGKSFNDEAVKKSIDVVVSRSHTSIVVGKMLHVMQTCSTPWAIAVVPGHKPQIIRGATSEEVSHSCQAIVKQFQATIFTERDVP